MLRRLHPLEVCKVVSESIDASIEAVGVVWKPGPTLDCGQQEAFFERKAICPIGMCVGTASIPMITLPD